MGRRQETGAATAIRVMLVDDHQLFREGTAQLLESESGIEIVGLSTSASEALEMLDDIGPDVVLVDINLPRENGFHFIREAMKRLAPPRVIVLSGYDETAYMVNAFQLGAYGFLAKTCSRAALIASIASVHRGQLVFTPEVLAARGRSQFVPVAQLTKREVEVLTALGAGHSNKQIAEQLFVSERTVHFHVSNILLKLGVSSRLEAVVKGRGTGRVMD